MAIAFLVSLLAAGSEYKHEGSVTAAFGDSTFERTLETLSGDDLIGWRRWWKRFEARSLWRPPWNCCTRRARAPRRSPPSNGRPGSGCVSKPSSARYAGSRLADV